MSTTAILKWAEQQFDGSIDRAIDALRYHQAQSAVNVLLNKQKKNPGAKTFRFERSGFIVVE